jgi:hypothetical protein
VERNKGQAFLGLVILIGGIISMVGILIAFLASSLIDTGYGLKASLAADAAATSGAQDALLQLDRNPSFSSVGYSVTAGSSTATVIVTNNSLTTGAVTVLSTATVSGRIRKVNVILAESSTTTQFTVVSWQEIQ